jgi:hypothetical protein
LPKPPVLLPAPKRAWAPTIISAALHGLLIVVAVGLSRRTAEPKETGDRQAHDTPRVDMIYVPPPEITPPPARPPPLRAPPVRKPAPQPPVRNTEPEPEPNAPSEATRTSGTETTSDLAESPETPVEEVTMESEARRIFGPRPTPAHAGTGPMAVRPMESWAAERPERCIPQQPSPRNAAEPVQLGTVAGRIFRQDTGRPLAGAHLQMLGTPYVAFTDGRGEYRFNFDLALVDNCRTQYVRVSATGYESRLLVLVVGPNRSEDVLLRRR